MHTVLGKGYQPADITLRHGDLPRAYLNKIAGVAVGDPTLDIKQVILNSMGQQNASKLDQDPEIACGDALAGPPVSTSPGDQSVRVDDTQPFPFYGDGDLVRVKARFWANPDDAGEAGVAGSGPGDGGE